MSRVVWLLSGLIVACASYPDGPQVAPSVLAPADHVVTFAGDERSPPCLVVELGQTVEFRNLKPDMPVDVTSLGTPVELFSPALVRGGAMATDQGGSYAWWRHTFARPGVFEYYDTHRGDPGQKLVDPYYGTVTWVGTNPNLHTGVVCVQEPGSNQCLGVCCVKNNDGSPVLSQGECPQNQCCDAVAKRCLALSPAGLAKIKKAIIDKLPKVAGNPRLGPCVARPSNFIAIGLNYADHAAEAGMKLPPEPIIFNKAVSCICGPNDNTITPKDSSKLDYEVELGIVIGKRASYLAKDKAMSVVAGYFLSNDLCNIYCCWRWWFNNIPSGYWC